MYSVSVVKLNSAQESAVASFLGPMLIIAGAGTGKTSTIIAKILNAIETGFAEPYQILATTFTNKAANELKTRLQKVLGGTAQSITIGTFHSISLDILQKHGFHIGIPGNISVLPYDDQIQIVRNILIKLNLKELKPSSILEKIQKYKEENGFISGVEEKILAAYTEELENSKMMDFADLLVNVIKLLTTSKEVKQFYHSTYKLLCIDEYQDINDLQYKWLGLLTHNNNHLCCVGDPDQAIYGFRGANANHILNFSKNFDNPLIIKLECNYRSSANVLRNANALISRNKKRISKDLYTDNLENKKKVLLYSTPSSKLEAIGVVEMIQSIKKENQDSNIAILVRSRGQIPEIEETLIRYQLSYSISGAMQFLDRAEIKDMMSYFKFLNNPNDTIAFRRMLQSPRRGIGEATLEKILEYSRENDTDFLQATKEIAKLSSKASQEKFDAFTSLLDEARQMLYSGLSNLANHIYVKSSYIDYITEERRENVRQWIRSLSEFTSLKEYIEKILWQAESDSEKKVDVQLMTIHASKGLEFDYVFLPGWEEGILPHDFARSEIEIEEERRLAYVALTRAIIQATISYSASRFMNGRLRQCYPSRFTKELIDVQFGRFASPTSIETGTEVRHPAFGSGTVQESGQDFVRVKFFDMTRLVEAKILKIL